MSLKTVRGIMVTIIRIGLHAMHVGGIISALTRVMDAP